MKINLIYDAGVLSQAINNEYHFSANEAFDADYATMQWDKYVYIRFDEMANEVQDENIKLNRQLMPHCICDFVIIRETNNIGVYINLLIQPYIHISQTKTMTYER